MSRRGVDRLGGKGPALLMENLGRLRKKAAHVVIASGKPATQMPAFGDRLSAAQIEALVELIYSPLPESPRWDIAEIRAGINTWNLTMAGDGRYVAVANYLLHDLVLLDASDLRPPKVVPTKSPQGISSR